MSGLKVLLAQMAKGWKGDRSIIIIANDMVIGAYTKVSWFGKCEKAVWKEWLGSISLIT